VLEADHVKPDPNDLLVAGDWTVVGHTLYTATPAEGANFIFDGVWKLKDVALSFSVIPHLVQVENSSGLTVTKVTGSEETYYVLETPDYLYDYDGGTPHSSMNGVQIPLPKLCRYSTDELIPPGAPLPLGPGQPGRRQHRPESRRRHLLRPQRQLQRGGQERGTGGGQRALQRETFSRNGLKYRASPAHPPIFWAFFIL
jgi:hypothetical protein